MGEGSQTSANLSEQRDRRQLGVGWIALRLRGPTDPPWLPGWWMRKASSTLRNTRCSDRRVRRLPSYPRMVGCCMITPPRPPGSAPCYRTARIGHPARCPFASPDAGRSADAGVRCRGRSPATRRHGNRSASGRQQLRQRPSVMISPFIPWWAFALFL